jgi:hypothetical protein
LPHTADFIRAKIGKKKNFSFSVILKLINIFIEESGKKCFFVVEEFTNLPDIFKDFQSSFLKFLVSQKKCMIVLTSSEVKKAQSILASDLNIIFAKFEKLFISENNFLSNYRYLRSLLLPQQNPSNLFCSFFVNIIDSNIPYYQVMSRYIRNYYQENELESIRQVVRCSLFERQSYFFQRFWGKVDSLQARFKDYISYLQLLLLISDGYQEKSDILSVARGDSRKLNTRLQRLTDLGYLSSYGNLYKIRDCLFGFWLSHVFRFYFYPSLLGSPQKQKMHLRKLNETLDIFMHNINKDKISRVAELFASFNSDYFKLGRSRIKLPKVEKTKVIFHPECKMHFLIGEGRDVVFAAIKETAVKDDDMFSYIERATPFRGKNIKKFFISLENFTSSAKLIAKQNKIINWNVNDINNLLSFYRKPVIIDEINCNV